VRQREEDTVGVTNFQSLSTCAAAGANLAVTHHQDGTGLGCDVRRKGHPAAHLDPGATWEQRRAFDWAYLIESLRLQLDTEYADPVALESAKVSARHYTGMAWL
jgi:hypothetical protein